MFPGSGIDLGEGAILFGGIKENTFNPPVGIFCAVAANHHAGMPGEPHADTAAMVKRHPGRTGRRIQQGVQ